MSDPKRPKPTEPPARRDAHPQAPRRFLLLVVLVVVGAVGLFFFQVGSSSAPSLSDISKIAAVDSDCQNYSTLDKAGRGRCNAEVKYVRDACKGDDTDRGEFINNNQADGGVSEAEAELSALCPQKESQ